MVVGGLFFNAMWHAAIRNREHLKPEIPDSVVRGMTRQFALGPVLYLVACLIGLINGWLSIIMYVLLIAFYMIDSMSIARRRQRT